MTTTTPAFTRQMQLATTLQRAEDAVKALDSLVAHLGRMTLDTQALASANTAANSARSIAATARDLLDREVTA